MTLPIYRLRRILAATAVLITLVVTGMYMYARLRTRNILKDVPHKIGLDIKQTANGFEISKSDGKRTLFTVQASAVKQFKLTGDAELHNVNIVLYGRDSSRFDQIYGDDFSFSQKTGDVTAKGDVQIDLVANPAGLTTPDQTIPKEVKNPIHLKTRDLVFNRDTGNAATDARVDFSTGQATGWADGVRYIGKTNTLTLESHIHLAVSGPQAGVIHAEHGVITNEPRVIVLDHPHFDHAVTAMQADQATFYLDSENNVQRVVATDHVVAQTKPSAADSSAPMHARADHAEFLLSEKQNLLQTGTLTGHVHLEQEGPQPMQGDAGRVILDYAGKNELQMVHALDGARLFQKAAQQTTAKNASPTSGPQDFELTAPVIDFRVVEGRLIEHAVTSGPAKITTSSPDSPASRTVVTAGKFDGQFSTDDGKNRLTSVRGAPNARIVNSVPDQPDRVSTSDSVVASFLPEGGIQSITQQDNVIFTDNQPPEKRMQAWARSARYTPADQMLVLTGSPRVASESMITTANTIRINRATGEALAQGDVKSTYSDVKEQPDGALLASSSPIHVTALSMTAHNTPGIALYSGNARLWQDANIIEAPSIQFDRDRRFVTAQGTAAQPVQTILVQQEKVQQEKAQPEKKSAPKSRSGQKSAETEPISITAMKLTYADAERRVHYEDHVFAKGTDFTATAATADAFLKARSQTSTNQSVSGLGQLDHMVAETNVVITEPNRHADGQKLVYTASDDKFVLTGGPPSIFDAEQGKITGVSLTFFRTDDRVLVEGEASTPVVTQTRVAR